MEGTAAVIDAGADEVREDVVGVGGADELADRQTHAQSEIPRQNVAEVSGGDGEVELLSGADFAEAHRVDVGGEVIDHLRDKPTDVDGVCRGKPLRHGGENGLHAGLGVVEVALDRADLDVLARLGDHLGLLHGADPVVGIKDQDADAVNIAEALERRLAGVAAGGGEDEDIVPVAELFRRALHQVGKQAQRHVLEGRRGAVEELKKQIVPGSSQRGDALIGEFARVGRGHQRLCLCLVKVGQEGGEDLRGQRRIIQRQEAAPVKLGDFPGGHDIEPAVGGKTVHNRAGGGNGG